MPSRLLARPAIRRALRDGLIVAGLLFTGYLFVVVAPRAGTFGFDAFAYWAVNIDHPYLVTTGGLGAFTYTPVAARAFALAGSLDWWQFLWLWEAILVATAVWLGRGSGTAGVFAVLAFPPVALELYHGNIHLLMAAAVVIGFEHPAAWAFILLTKVTPGVSIIWFVVRREWRSLAVVTAVTGAIFLASVVVDARLWSEWIGSVTSTAEGTAPLGQFSIGLPLWLRIPAAAVLVAWGGLSDRRWTVPLGATLALPVLWPSGFAILAALWSLGRVRRSVETQLPRGAAPSV